MIHLIACIDSAGGLGRENGSLLFHIKDDLKRFRDKTKGNIVVSGRKTFESIVQMNGKPLPNRINVVLTKNENYTPQHGEIIFHDVEHILNHHQTMTEDDKEVWVIGGAMTYELLLPYVNTIHLTIVNKHIEDAEIFYPMKLQESEGFIPVEEEEHYSEEYECFYKFVTYKRKENEGD